MVWKFRTLPPQTVADPNLLGWWKLDEAMGKAIDYSGHGYHGEIRGGAKPVAGMAGGALEFDGMNDYVYIGKNAGRPGDRRRKAQDRSPRGSTRAASTTVAFSTWARTHQRAGLLPQGTRRQQPVACPVLRSVDHDFTYTSLNAWVHFAVVYDGDQSTCYANGVAVSTAARALNTAVTNPFQIGGYGWPGNFFHGMIDDVRLYNKALTPDGGPDDLHAGRPVAGMESPSPAVGTVTDALQAVPLTWKPGDGVVQHDVYLATDPDVILDADRPDATGAYRGRQDANSYMPDPELQWNKRYYWRIDEVTADGDVVKGRIWDFTTTDWLIVEDFESYTNELAEPDLPDLAR